MTSARTRAPVAALVVYAALGVALGMVVWALVLHGGTGTGSGGGHGAPSQTDQSQDGGTKGQLWEEDG